MNNSMRDRELTATLIAAFACTLSVSGGLNLSHTADSAAWLSALLSGVLGAVLSVLLMKLGGSVGYLEACAGLNKKGKAQGIGTAVFPPLLAVLFFALSVMSFKSLVDMQEAYLLPLTPRSLQGLLLFIAILPGCYMGIAGLSRAVKLILPLMGLMYAVTLFLSAQQAEVNNFFPLLGDGAGVVVSNGAVNTAAFLWIFAASIERGQLKKPLGSALKAVIWASVAVAVGFACFIAVNPPGSPTQNEHPIMHLSTMGGFSAYFQHVKSMFAFVWLPLFAVTSGVGLIYAARCLASAFAMDDPRPLLIPLGVLLLCFSVTPSQADPAWLSYLYTYPWILLCLLPVLLAPPVIQGIKEASARRKNRV